MSDNHKQMVQVTKILEHNIDPLIGTGYTVKGFLVGELSIGEPLVLLRTERNNVKAIGIFRTSPIEDIYLDHRDVLTVTTKNSTYSVISLKETDEDQTLPPIRKDSNSGN